MYNKFVGRKQTTQTKVRAIKSSPKSMTPWGISSIGRAPALHAGG